MRAGHIGDSLTNRGKLVLGAGTLLTTAAAALGLYHVLKAEPQVAQDKAPTTPTKQEEPKVPSYTRGGMVAGFGEER